MADYRVYVLNDHNKIVEATDIHARDDTHVFEVAERVSGARPLEIWQGTRLVGRYNRHVIQLARAGAEPTTNCTLC